MLAPTREHMFELPLKSSFKSDQHKVQQYAPCRRMTTDELLKVQRCRDVWFKPKPQKSEKKEEVEQDKGDSEQVKVKNESVKVEAKVPEVCDEPRLHDWVYVSCFSQKKTRSGGKRKAEVESDPEEYPVSGVKVLMFAIRCIHIIGRRGSSYFRKEESKGCWQRQRQRYKSAAWCWCQQQGEYSPCDTFYPGRC